MALLVCISSDTRKRSTEPCGEARSSVRPWRQCSWAEESTSCSSSNPSPRVEHRTGASRSKTTLFRRLRSVAGVYEPGFELRRRLRTLLRGNDREQLEAVLKSGSGCAVCGCRPDGECSFLGLHEPRECCQPCRMAVELVEAETARAASQGPGVGLQKVYTEATELHTTLCSRLAQYEGLVRYLDEPGVPRLELVRPLPLLEKDLDYGLGLLTTLGERTKALEVDDRNREVQTSLVQYILSVEERLRPGVETLLALRKKKVRDGSPLLSPQLTPRLPTMTPPRPRHRHVKDMDGPPAVRLAPQPQSLLPWDLGPARSPVEPSQLCAVQECGDASDSIECESPFRQILSGAQPPAFSSILARKQDVNV